MVLPDLLLHHRAARLGAPTLAAARPRGEEERALLAGLLEHARADAAFHASPAFAAWRRALRPAVAAAGAGGAVGTLLIHVGIEVALDRLLLLAEPDLASALYAALEPLETGALGAALAGLAGEEARPLAETLALFRSHRHLAGWSERARAGASLARVCAALVRDPGRRPDPDACTGFLAAAEAALLGSPYAPTTIGDWLG